MGVKDPTVSLANIRRAVAGTLDKLLIHAITYIGSTASGAQLRPSKLWYRQPCAAYKRRRHHRIIYRVGASDDVMFGHLWSNGSLITSAPGTGWRLCFHPCLSVYLFVCEQEISKKYGRILMKFCAQVGCVTRMN